MQRICKYPLLFRELVRYSLPDSPECRKLEQVSPATTHCPRFGEEQEAHTPLD